MFRALCIFVLLLFLTVFELYAQENSITLEDVIDNTPVPVVQFGSPHSCFRSQPMDRLIVNLVGFDFDAKCIVESYTVKRIRINEKTRYCKVKGPMFNNCVINRITESLSGDEFEFSNIMVMCPGYDEPQLTKGILYQKIR